MKNFVILCGLNGTGKSTLGRALADALSWWFVDAEQLYFAENTGDHAYAAPRTDGEARAALQDILDEHDNVILASVKGNFCADFLDRLTCAVYLAVPDQVRQRRLYDRSFAKFGARMCPGGDLYEQEKAFLDFAAARQEQTVENWLAVQTCPVIRVDGTLPIADNVVWLKQYFCDNG